MSEAMLFFIGCALFYIGTQLSRIAECLEDWRKQP